MQFGHVKLQSMRKDRRGFDWNMIQLLTEQRSPLKTMYSSTPKSPLQHTLRSLGESWGDIQPYWHQLGVQLRK